MDRNTGQALKQLREGRMDLSPEKTEEIIAMIEAGQMRVKPHSAWWGDPKKGPDKYVILTCEFETISAPGGQSTHEGCK